MNHEEIDLKGANDEELGKISDEFGLALDLEEMKRIRDYFTNKNRNPTDIELQALGQAWSEHCCYKSSKSVLEEFIFNIDAPQNILVIKEDAGVVEFDDDHAYVIAFESHNHPSAIEPYGGASTGIGGIIRDVVCMGAQPIALIDPLFFGRLEEKQEGIKHPKYLFSGVISGISDYGNRVGIPTCAGMVYFDDGYLGNCVVNVGCVGILKKEKVIRSRASVGNLFVLVGGKTGRDGIHGVTFASSSLGEKSEEYRGAVQLGDPICKEPLIHACLEAAERGLLRGMKDLGGGGLSCVILEMASSGGCGAEIALDKVPLKERFLNPWEIWISESQERFMLAVHPDDLEEVLYIFERWDIDATVIGKAINESIIRVSLDGEKIFEMEVDLLAKPPLYHRKYKRREIKRYYEKFDEPDDYNEVLLSILSSPNVSSREYIIRQYDHEVRASTVVGPLQGMIEDPTHGDAVVIKPLEDSFRGIALTSDVNPSYMKIDPFWGAASAIDEVCRNLCAVGAIPHSFADCLNFGNPEKIDSFSDFYEACRGLGYVAKSISVPFVSGNVSFYNEFMKNSIPPTPTILGVGIVHDIRRCTTVDVKEKGNHLYLIGETKEEIGGSEYAKLMGVNGNVPRVDVSLLKDRMNLLISMIDRGFIASCHDVSEGGIGVCLSEMLIGGRYGAEIDLSVLGRFGEAESDFPSGNRSTLGYMSDFKLFSESNTRWIIEVKREMLDAFLESLKDERMVYDIGIVGGDDLIVKDGGRTLIDMPIEDLRNSWKKKNYQ
jgi:phosphoribosylformylglycinamidine synthase